MQLRGWTHDRKSRFGILICAALTLLVVNTDQWAIAAKDEKQVAHLYFADTERPFLVSESRVMINTDDPIDFGRQLIVELINGPADANMATIPEGTQLRGFFLLDDDTAVVDFSGQLRENHPGGCRLEQLTLFSIVNSLVLNVSEIDRVIILIDGMEIQTLAGHLPLTFPLTADLLLTR